MKLKKNLLTLSSICLALSSTLSAQDTLDWRSEATNGNWNELNNWWSNGTTTPPGSEILIFDNNVETTMTNDAANTTRHQIIFGENATTPRTINGTTANEFVAIGANGALIQNNSSNIHHINFPVIVGNDGLTIDTATEALALNGDISGTGTITKDSGGRIEGGGWSGEGVHNLGISGNNENFTGKWVVNGGNLSINSDAALGAEPSSFVADSITLNGGSLTNMSSLNKDGGFGAGHDLNLHENRGITITEDGGNFRIGYGRTVTVNGAITGPGLLKRTDGGTLVLNAQNSYEGITFLNAGTTRAGVDGALPNGTQVLFYAGSSLDLNGTTQSVSALLSGSNSDTNTTLQLGSGGADLTVTGTSLNGNLTNSGGDLYTKITGKGDITLDHSTNKNAHWSLLNENNDFEGTLTIRSGRLRSAIGTEGQAGIPLGLGATTNDIIFDGEIVESLTNGGGSASLQQASGNSFTLGTERQITLNDGKEGTFYVWGGQTVTVDSIITGGGNLRKEDGGTLLLNNTNNDYTGRTRIAQGTIELGADEVIPTASTVELAGGSLKMANKNQTVTSLIGSGGTVGDGGTLTVLTSDTATYNGVVNNDTTLHMAGTGTQILAGTNDNSDGRAKVSSGTLILAKEGASSSRAVGRSDGETALTITGGTARLSGAHEDQIYDESSVEITRGSLDMNGRNETIRGLHGTAGIVENTATGTTSTLTLGTNTTTGITNFNFAGTIEDGLGQMALTKTGIGTQSLSGTNTYTGETIIENGILALVGDGSIAHSSQITLGATSAVLDLTNLNGNWALTQNQTLSGTGEVAGSAIIHGALNPGTSPGTIVFRNDLTLGTSATLDFELNPTDTTAGAGINDLITVASDLILAGTLNVSELGSFDETYSGTWTLFTYQGSLTDNGLALGTMPELAPEYSWQLGSNADSVYLTIIPEPSIALLGALSSLLLLRRRR